MLKRPTAPPIAKALRELQVPEGLIADPPKPKHAGGRPSTYTVAIGEELCARMSSGELLLEICTDPRMPATSTVWYWKRANPEFAAAYARAREDQAEACAMRAVIAARSAKAEDAAAARVKFDGERWFASKLDPRTYGDRQQLEISGELAVVSSEPMTPDEWEKKHAARVGTSARTTARAD